MRCVSEVPSSTVPAMVGDDWSAGLHPAAPNVGLTARFAKFVDLPGCDSSPLVLGISLEPRNFALCHNPSLLVDRSPVCVSESSLSTTRGDGQSCPESALLLQKYRKRGHARLGAHRAMHDGPIGRQECIPEQFKKRRAMRGGWGGEHTSHHDVGRAGGTLRISG